MTDHPMDPPHSPRQRGEATEAELRELRSLLFGPDLQSRLATPTVRSEDVSRVLPEAIVLSRDAQEQLTTAVVPTIEDAIKSSVHKDQYVLSEALFPIIGPATRKAVAVALQDFTQTLNQGLDQSLSPKSLQWRFEAWRTGKSFAEIVILHTLIYRVEQVFLIHKKTGLLLQHIVETTAIVQDPELISAMLTAIQDFVRDSFVVSSNDTLDTLHFGELTIWIEDGPHAVIAAVIHGNAPADIRLVFQHNLEKIHLVLGQQLEDFQGDNAPFTESQPYLEDCLQRQFKSKRKSIPPLVFILVPLLCFLGYWAFTTWRDNQQWGIYVERLDSSPGLVVQKSYIRNGHYYLRGMRDPEAIDPLDQQLLKDLDLNPKQVTYQWEPYWSFDSEIVAARAKRLLDSPPGVDLKLTSQQILVATGVADQEWRHKFLQEGKQLAGILEVDDQGLESQEVKYIQELKKKIEGLSLLFPVGKNILSGQQQEKLKTLVDQSSELIEWARKIDLDVIIYVNGYTDSVGTEQRNIVLSQARANFIRNQLIANKIPPQNLRTRALGDRGAVQELEASLEPDSHKRKVSLQIDIQG